MRQYTKTTVGPADMLILKHLRARGTISPAEAIVQYGCHSLAPRIFRLRRAGYRIFMNQHMDESGRRYARYILDMSSARMR